MAYKNLTLTAIDCFGITTPKTLSWVNLLLKANKEFNQLLDREAFVTSLQQNVDSSYYRLFTFFVKDIDTDFEYAIFVDNSKGLLDVEFKTMPNDHTPDLILPNEKADLLRNDCIKNAVKRAIDLMTRAKSLVEETIMPHVENGELLEVDEIRLEAILSYLNDKNLMSNVSLRKYVR